MPFCNKHHHAYVKVCTQCVLDKHADRVPDTPHKPTGSYLPRESISNQRIIARNAGVRPQFVNDVGGCDANYK